MSRSFKKTNVCTDTNDKFFKNYSNRIIRNKNINFEIKNGKFYKKLLCSYNICDYKFYKTLKEELKDTYEYFLDNKNTKNITKSFYNKQFSYMNWYRYNKMK